MPLIIENIFLIASSFVFPPAQADSRSPINLWVSSFVVATHTPLSFTTETGKGKYSLLGSCSHQLSLSTSSLFLGSVHQLYSLLITKSLVVITRKTPNPQKTPFYLTLF